MNRERSQRKWKGAGGKCGTTLKHPYGWVLPLAAKKIRDQNPGITDEQLGNQLVIFNGSEKKHVHH